MKNQTNGNTAAGSSDVPVPAGGMLQLFVRQSDVAPPLSNPTFFYNRISAQLLWASFWICYSHVYSFHHYSFLWSFGLHMMISNFNSAIDGCVSNNWGYNIVNLRKAGFDDRTIAFYFQFNLFSSQLLGYLVMTQLVADPAIFTAQHIWTTWMNTEAVYLIGSFVAIVVNMAFGEATFYAAHKVLHESTLLVPFHVFHHCCTHSSWTTNLLFHPIDLALEFGGPVFSCVALHYGLWMPILGSVLARTVLWITYLIIQLWYAYDHDQCLKLWHVQHHTHCDRLYAIYTPFLKGRASDNLLKMQLQKSGLLDKKIK
jgi:hypothetical protein